MPMAATATTMDAPAAPPFTTVSRIRIGFRRKSGLSARAVTSTAITAQNPAIAGERPATSTAMMTAMGITNISESSIVLRSIRSRCSGGIGWIPALPASSETATNSAP